MVIKMRLLLAKTQNFEGVSIGHYKIHFSLYFKVFFIVTQVRDHLVQRANWNIHLPDCFSCRSGSKSAASFINLGLSIDSPFPLQSANCMKSTETIPTIPEHRRLQTKAWWRKLDTLTTQCNYEIINYFEILETKRCKKKLYLKSNLSRIYF